MERGWVVFDLLILTPNEPIWEEMFQLVLVFVALILERESRPGFLEKNNRVVKSPRFWKEKVTLVGVVSENYL